MDENPLLSHMQIRRVSDDTEPTQISDELLGHEKAAGPGMTL